MAALRNEHEALEQYRIQDAPLSMFYIPNFITLEEEEYILNKIPANKWISLSHRRLQAVPARLTANNTLIASSGLPDWLNKPVLQRFESFEVLNDSPHGRPNHCLINEYRAGQGIMPHEDGAAYHPVVATVSLAGGIVLDVTEKKIDNLEAFPQKQERNSWRILQEPRSLLVTTGSAYTDTLHGIAELTEDVDLNEDTIANWDLLGDRKSVTISGGHKVRATRISLTLRDVLKVSNVGTKIFGRPKG